jgi:ANTH domain
VDLLDYMDEILKFQAAVFFSLERTRSNSMTNAGQCRLAALLPFIEDSCHVYDCVIKLLTILHQSELHKFIFRQYFLKFTYILKIGIQICLPTR